MLINFNQKLKNYNGKPITHDRPVENGGPMEVTLRWACCEALMGNVPGEKLEGEVKIKRYLLAQKIYQKDVELTAEETADLKHLIGIGFSTAVAGAALPLLDPAMVKEEITS